MKHDKDEVIQKPPWTATLPLQMQFYQMIDLLHIQENLEVFL